SSDLDERHRPGALQLHHAVIVLPGQQTQREADHPLAVAQHPVDGKVSLAGVGRTEDGNHPVAGGGIHKPEDRPLLAFVQVRWSAVAAAEPCSFTPSCTYQSRTGCCGCQAGCYSTRTFAVSDRMRLVGSNQVSKAHSAECSKENDGN